MNTIIGPMLIAFIQAKYEGGVDKFVLDGGRLGLSPTSAKEIIIYHPGLSQELKDCLNKFLANWEYTVKFSEQRNYPDMDEQERYQIINEGVNKASKDSEIYQIAISISPELFVANILDPTVSSEQANRFAECFKESLPGLAVGYVVYRDGIVRIDRSVEVASKGQHVVLEATKRDVPISQNDIVDLKISLETMTADEFIKNI